MTLEQQHVGFGNDFSSLVPRHEVAKLFPGTSYSCRGEGSRQGGQPYFHWFKVAGVKVTVQIQMVGSPCHTSARRQCEFYFKPPPNWTGQRHDPHHCCKPQPIQNHWRIRKAHMVWKMEERLYFLSHHGYHHIHDIQDYLDFSALENSWLGGHTYVSQEYETFTEPAFPLLGSPHQTLPVAIPPGLAILMEHRLGGENKFQLWENVLLPQIHKTLQSLLAWGEYSEVT